MRKLTFLWMALGCGVISTGYCQNNIYAFKPLPNQIETFPALIPGTAYHKTKPILTLKEYFASEAQKAKGDQKYLAITIKGG